MVNYTTLTTQGFLSSSSFLSASNNFTGNNTFQNYTTFKASLDLHDGTGAKDGSIKMTSAGVLSINTNVPSGSINFSSDNTSGVNFSRATIKENEFNFEVPLTTSISASQYTSFTSTTIGYKTPTGTVLIPALSSGSGINSGQLILAQGVWKIDYTATINITTTMTTLTSLEVFVANSSNVDLDIQLSPHEVAMRDVLSLFEVEDILSHSGNNEMKNSDWDFLCKFAGWDDSYNLWLPYKEVSSNPAMHRYAITNRMRFLIPQRFKHLYRG